MLHLVPVVSLWVIAAFIVAFAAAVAVMYARDNTAGFVVGVVCLLFAFMLGTRWTDHHWQALPSVGYTFPVPEDPDPVP